MFDNSVKSIYPYHMNTYFTYIHDEISLDVICGCSEDGNVRVKHISVNDSDNLLSIISDQVLVDIELYAENYFQGINSL